MNAYVGERRRYPRLDCTGIVNIAVKEGKYKGTTLVGMLSDFSEGGLCVLLDGGVFERGTPVQVECEDGLTLTAWVCHYTRVGESSRLGLSFEFVSYASPEHCFDAALCSVND